jgi:phosphoglycolate phosphatase
MQKTIIFDFDGTIVDSKDLIIQLYNELAEKNNYKKIDKSNFKSLSELPIVERCKVLNVPIYKIPALVYEVMKNYKNYLVSINIVDGIRDVLFKLKENGFNLGIISSNSISTIEEFLVKNKIDIFDSIYSAKNIFGKHHTINGLVKKFNLDKKYILYVGDEIRDIISCKKACAKIVAVTWGYDSTELLLDGKPDFIVNSPAEILDVANML